MAVTYMLAMAFTEQEVIQDGKTPMNCPLKSKNSVASEVPREAFISVANLSKTTPMVGVIVFKTTITDTLPLFRQHHG